ncbi:MAG: hypothetical protein ACI91B_004602, partial [Planctomycetota bacterium]
AAATVLTRDVVLNRDVVERLVVFVGDGGLKQLEVLGPLIASQACVLSLTLLILADCTSSIL